MHLQRIKSIFRMPREENHVDGRSDGGEFPGKINPAFTKQLHIEKSHIHPVGFHKFQSFLPGLKAENLNVRQRIADNMNESRQDILFIFHNDQDGRIFPGRKNINQFIWLDAQHLTESGKHDDIRHPDPGFPVADRFPGDEKRIRKLTLCQSFFSAQIAKFFTESIQDIHSRAPLCLL